MVVLHKYERILMEYEEYKIKKIISTYVSPIILIIGTTGNLISFIILRKNMFRISTYFYLAILALADLVVLQFGLLRLWTGELTAFDIRNTNNGLCRLVVALSYAGSDFSVWLIVAVTVERFIAVCFPLQANTLCSVNKARIVTLILFFMICCLNLHFLWTVEIETINLNFTQEFRCVATPASETFVNDIWPLIDAFVYSFIPCSICAILNIFIVRQVFAARKCRNRLQHCKSGRNNLLHKTLPSEGAIKLSMMLLAVSVTFIVTTLPNSIIVVVKNYWNWNVESTEDFLQELSNLALASTITEHLMFINHSVNFFLYCATGKKFRGNMERVLCKLRPSARSLSDSACPQTHLVSRASYSAGRLSLNYIMLDSKITNKKTTKL